MYAVFLQYIIKNLLRELGVFHISETDVLIELSCGNELFYWIPIVSRFYGFGLFYRPWYV
ncbi:hypothetical protein BVRB_7g157840 [Beta vulgaris subsp. vulgaris]|nr:hypothetical protein BVRB_7g157840 [Beta vulgaris subsp. vulgaris]